MYSSTSSYTSNTDTSKRYNNEPDYSALADSKSGSGDMFRKKKDYKDVKSPDKDKKVGYASGIASSTSPHDKTSKDKEIASKTISETAKGDKKPSAFAKSSSPTSYNPSPSNSKMETKITIRDFDVGKSKGEGKFGQVFVARHKLTSTLYALKKIPKQVIKDHHM